MCRNYPASYFGIVGQLLDGGEKPILNCDAGRVLVIVGRRADEPLFFRGSNHFGIEIEFLPETLSLSADTFHIDWTSYIQRQEKTHKVASLLQRERGRTNRDKTVTSDRP